MRKITKRLGTVVATVTLAATFATSSAEAASYTVKYGDTLWSIAQKYSTSVSSLQSANGISGHIIYPGQTIKTSSSSNTVSAKHTTSSVSGALFNWPAVGNFSSGYGHRSIGYHRGIDIANRTGTTIKAAASGRVTRSGYSSSYGNVIYIYHPQFNKTTVYAHMSSRYVSYGQSVSSGQTIGRMGSTGHAYGSHLHFEVHNGGWNYRSGINPMPYLK